MWLFIYSNSHELRRTAIARGALQRGLDGSIVREQRARRHYGTVASTLYISGNGSEYDSHRIWSDARDEWRVENQMSYFVGKGMVVDDTFSKPLDFFIDVLVHDFDERETYNNSIKLLACDTDDAPNFKWQNPTGISSLLLFSITTYIQY